MTSRKLRYHFPQVRRETSTDQGWNCLIFALAVVALMAAVLIVLYGMG
jgi:hypothetical protein